jgi:hypothetical protein
LPPAAVKLANPEVFRRVLDDLAFQQLPQTTEVVALPETVFRH